MNLILLIGQIAFLILLYLFLFKVVRVMGADLKRQAGVAVPHVARGTGRAQLVVVQGEQPARGERFVLSSPVVTIGRNPANELPIQDTYASSEHARLSAQDGIFYLEDLGSSNGTFVNGHRLGEPIVLRHGDRIELGDTVFRFEEME
jgi:hypothetical protein